MIAPDTVEVNGTDITSEVFDALSDLYREDLSLAEQKQKEAMAEEYRLTGGERAHLPYGRLRMRIHPDVFHFWGTKLGYECWQDKDFLGWMEKRFGNLVAVKSKSRKPTVPVTKKYNPDDKYLVA
jgi:hypothetical protein